MDDKCLHWGSIHFSLRLYLSDLHFFLFSICMYSRESRCMLFWVSGSFMMLFMHISQLLLYRATELHDHLSKTSEHAIIDLTLELSYQPAVALVNRALVALVLRAFVLPPTNFEYDIDIVENRILSHRLDDQIYWHILTWLWSGKNEGYLGHRATAKYIYFNRYFNRC